jgi:hypothetical protein
MPPATAFMRVRRIVTAINMIFWPIVGGMVIMNFVLPKEITAGTSNHESERIRKMLDDVYKKTPREKIEDAMKTLGLMAQEAHHPALPDEKGPEKSV